VRPQEHLFEMAKRSEEAYNRWVEAKQGDAKQPSTKLSWRHSAVSWISRRWQDQPTVKLAVLAVFVLVAVLAVFVLRQEVNSCSVELGEQRNVSVSLSRSLEAERADLDRKKKEAADLKSKAQQLRKDYDSKKNETKENAKLRENYESMKKEVAELKKQLKEKKEAADLESKKTCTLF
jgi:Tfp pilus assembly protein PilO